MKQTDDRLIQWAIDETRDHYHDQVSLLLEHNTYCLEEDRGRRYVNSIISDAKEYLGLSRTFIIGGLGYDMNQVTWDHLERYAELKSYYVTVLAEGKILYSKTEADRQRFAYLQTKLAANLADPLFMYDRSLEWLGSAMELYKTMVFEESLCGNRKAAGFIRDYLAVAVACYNQTYFSSFAQVDELRTMEHAPECFIEQYCSLEQAKTIEDLQAICHALIQTTRTFLTQNDRRERKANGPSTYTELAEWYQECSYYFRRIYHFCAKVNATLVFGEATHNQADLDDIAASFGIGGLDLLTFFDPNDLSAFAENVKLAESAIVKAIESAGETIDAYTSVEEFLAKNA